MRGEGRCLIEVFLHVFFSLFLHLSTHGFVFIALSFKRLLYCLGVLTVLCSWERGVAPHCCSFHTGKRGQSGKVERTRGKKNKKNIYIYICLEISFSPLLLVCGGQICLRGDSIETERIPGLHPIPAAEREGSGPGGTGKDHPWCAAWMPGTLQQLWGTVPEPRPLCGEVHWLHL